MADLNRWLQRQFMSAWYGGGWWVWLFLPVTWLFRLLAAVRRQHLLRQHARCQNQKPPVPVIVVGNITLGGTGKTPLLIALARFLKSRGYQPGVISRGYGGDIGEAAVLVTQGSVPADVGDEPVLIARESGCPVMVGRDRLSAAQALFEQTRCNVILSDDGLQHYRLPRDIEIVVIDASRGLGNRQCLPVGPLREPPLRLNQVDWVIFNGTGGDTRNTLAGTSVRQSVTMELNAENWFCVAEDSPSLPLSPFPFSVADNSVQPAVHALAGIGNPARFFSTLDRLGVTHIAHAFPDHYQYRAEDLVFEPPLPIVMTAKDAVKCQAFAPQNCWYLSVSAQLPHAFLEGLLEQIQALQGKCGTPA